MSLAATGRAIVFRLGADLAVTNREAEYGQLLRAARDLGYRIVTVAELWDRREAARGERLLAIRHDVDIRNAAGNAMFLRVELAHGAKATSYFRRWTTAAHAAHIERLHAAGFEVGYHFEEAATVAKELGLTTREAVLEQRERIRDRFAANCAEFRQRWSPEMRSVSSHGDWVNRRLGFVNNEFLDAELRERCGLDFEAYDEPLMAVADVYVSDVAAPPARWAHGYSLGDALRDGRSPIYILAHERQWHGNPIATTQANLDRVVDDLAFRRRTRA